MLNLFKKKEVITYYEGELSYKEMESRLTTEQTWGTDKKIYRLFFDHLKLKTTVLEFQSIIQNQPKKLFKLAYYYIITQYWHHFSGWMPIKRCVTLNGLFNLKRSEQS
jgi:hypothetical protein